MIVLDLPSPPSVNNLFINKRGRGRITSPHYTQWKELAGWELQRQRPNKIRGPVTVKIEHEDAGRIDGDNKLKPLFDLLVAHQVIEDDKRAIVRSFSFEWVPNVTGVRVTVTPLGRAA